MNWRYKHILWDWNGTLVNDMDLCVSVTNALIKKRNGSPINREIYEREFTFPVVDFYEKIGFDFASESYEVVAEEWIRQYKSHFGCSSSLNGAVIAVLDEIKQMGLQQSILSACESHLLSESVKHLRLEGYFHSIHGTDNNHAHGKVNVAHSLIKQQPYSRDESILFGDTVHDYEVAVAIGIDCVLIANGHQHEDRLRETGVPVIDDISHVPNFIKSLQ